MTCSSNIHFKGRARFYGTRQMVRQLQREGICVGRHRVRRLMRLTGLEAIHQAPRTSGPHPGHRIYPFLLKNMVIDRPNQVWCADITCIPVQRGFLYLDAIMDWAIRHVPAWRLSNTMDGRFCVEALNEALSRYGSPEIFKQTKAANSPALTSPVCSRVQRSQSPWMAEDGAWTISSLSGYGARSSTKPSICMN